MIDLHCHLLPGLDDGPQTVEDALALARLSVANGITVVACTPHILPGVYDNGGPDIRMATATLQTALDEAGIALRLLPGADVHMSPENVAGLRSGRVPCLSDTHFVLIEPPCHVLPPRSENTFFDLAAADYRPILTHPERMGWIEHKYDLVKRLAAAGVLMQLTAASFIGGFGRRASYWAERMLDDGLVDLVATDAHDTRRRPPLLREAYEAVTHRIGAERANAIFLATPQAILEDRPIIRARRGFEETPVAMGAIFSKRWLDMGVAWMRRS